MTIYFISVLLCLVNSLRYSSELESFNMWTQGTVRVYREFKPFLVICKLFGLAPYKIKLDIGDGTLDMRVKENLGGFFCTILVTCAMTLGLSDMVSHVGTENKSSVSDILTTKFSMPMFFAVTLTALLMNSTIIKFKMSQLFDLFSNIDKQLYRLKKVPDEESSFSKKILSNVDIFLLLFVFSPYLLYDALIWGIGLFHINSYLLRFSEFINIIIVMMYCRWVIYVWKILVEMCEMLPLYIKIDPEDVVNENDRIPDISEVQLYRNPKQKYPLNLTEFVISLRRLYCQVCSIVHLINVMYGFIILLEIIVNFTVIITNVSVFMSLITEKEEIIPIHLSNRKPVLFSNSCFLVISVCLLVIMTLICHVATSKSQDLALIIGRFSLEYPLHPDALQQLKLFSYQLRYDSFHFSAFWLFRLDFNLLCTILASAVTYTTVLAQFNT